MAKHPWFQGKTPAHLLVHRVYVGDGGKEKPGRLMGGKLYPHELQEDSQVREKFGPGRYRISARDANMQLCGPAYVVDIPDETGHVPVTEDGADGGGGGGDKVTMRDLLRAAEQRMGDMQKHYDLLLKNASASRDADLKFFSSMVENTVKTLSAALTDNKNGRFEEWMFKRVEALERDAKSERKSADEWKEKSLRSDDGIMSMALSHAPQVLEFFKPSTRVEQEAKKKLLEELEDVSKLRKHLKGEMARIAELREELEAKLKAIPAGPPSAAPASAASKVETAEERFTSLPPEALEELFSGGGELQEEAVMMIRKLHAAGKVPAGLVVVLRKYKVLADEAAPANN